jgi:hypothetical protein
MDRYKEGYNDCNREWKKKIQDKIKKLTKEINEIEEKDIGVGFTLGKEWSDKKAIVKEYEDLLKKG